jgi:YbbR domain-containing protein
LKVTRLSPSYVDVHLERIVTKSVPVEVRLAGDPPPGFKVARVVAVPDRATVEGAKSELEKVSAVLTDWRMDGAAKISDDVYRLNYFGKYTRSKGPVDR